MNLDLKNVMGQLGNVWNGISLSHKFIMIMMTMGFIGGIIGVTQWARKPDFALLYGDLGRKKAVKLSICLKRKMFLFKYGGTGLR